jgi:hypothetical protein
VTGLSNFVDIKSTGSSTFDILPTSTQLLPTLDNELSTKKYVDIADASLNALIVSTDAIQKTYIDIADASLNALIISTDALRKTYIDVADASLNTFIVSTDAIQKTYIDSADASLNTFINNLQSQIQRHSTITTNASYTLELNTISNYQFFLVLDPVSSGSYTITIPSPSLVDGLVIKFYSISQYDAIIATPSNIGDKKFVGANNGSKTLNYFSYSNQQLSLIACNSLWYVLS